MTGRHIRIRTGSEPKTFLAPMFENIYSISMKYQNEEITLEKICVYLMLYYENFVIGSSAYGQILKNYRSADTW